MRVDPQLTRLRPKTHSQKKTNQQTNKQQNRALAEFEKAKDRIAADVTGQMGKPLKQAHGELKTLVARGRALVEMAPAALADVALPAAQGFAKSIRREPLGVVLVLAPWNYPLITAASGVFASVLSGNSVLLKHSDRTPLCADHYAQAFAAAGAPPGLVQALHADHDLVHKLIARPEVAHVVFTGSVPGGRLVYQTVSRRANFPIDCTLELGGKDAAYVAADARLDEAVDGVVDGAMYNAGQSCCSVERVFVHESLYDAFVAKSVELASRYVLGDPRSDATTMGPIAQPRHIGFLESQVRDAVSKGASLLLGGRATTDKDGRGRFFQPTVLGKCAPHMNVMRLESFGPILAVSAVPSDEAAVAAINDSDFGLTASVWTASRERAEALAPRLNAGTVYMNRCDFLDPYLPWSGRKNSGKGLSLSHLAFHALTRTKGYNFKF